MDNPTQLPDFRENVGGLASLLISCIEEEERLLDSICLAVENGSNDAVLSLARQLSDLRTASINPQLSEGSR